MKRILQSYISILLALTCSSICDGKEALTPRIQHFGEHDGYQQLRVNYAIQDQFGYIWFSTWNGLCRYDGYRFVYYYDCSGADSIVARHSTLFIRELPNHDIEGVTKDSLFYVFYRQQQRYEFSKGDFQKTVKSYQPDSSIVRRLNSFPQFKGMYYEVLLVDRQGGIWVYTNSGLYRVFYDRPPLRPEKSGNYDEEVVMALFTDNQGRLWSGDRNGFVRVRDQKSHSTYYLSPDGTLSSRPVCFGYDAYCFFQDSFGNMWIGTKPEGLFRLSSSSIRHYKHQDDNPYSLSCDNVYSITEDNDHRLWIATVNGGLNMLNLQDDDGRFIHYHNQMKTYPVDALSLRAYRVRCLGGNDPVLLVGTDNGLLAAKPTKQPEQLIFQRYGLLNGSPSSLGSNRVCDIEPINDKTTAIGTLDGGISIVDNDKLLTGKATFQRITTRNGLASNQCIAVSCISGMLYVVSNTCISRLFLNRPSYTAYGQWNSIMRPILDSYYNLKEAKPTLGRDGSLYFGTTQGLLRITNNDLQRKAFHPDIVFDSPDTICLSADEYSFDIHFAALDYNKNTDIVYAYYWEGNNEQWIYTTENHIYLHDIKAGTHRLHLRSTNGDGVWVDNERVLTIRRSPHFNETPWAWMLYGLLITLFIIGVVQTVIYIRRLKRELKDIRLTSGQRIDMMANHIRELLSIRETVKPAQTAAPTDNMENEEDQHFVNEVRQLVMKNLSNTSYSVQDLARDLLVGRNVLYARMNAIFGTSPYNYLLNVRIEESKKLLRGKDPYIADIAYRCGFSDPKYFSRCFKNVVGMTPSEYITNQTIK